MLDTCGHMIRARTTTSGLPPLSGRYLQHGCNMTAGFSGCRLCYCAPMLRPRGAIPLSAELVRRAA
jgi:hypothetical protein